MKSKSTPCCAGRVYVLCRLTSPASVTRASLLSSWLAGGGEGGKGREGGQIPTLPRSLSVDSHSPSHSIPRTPPVPILPQPTKVLDAGHALTAAPVVVASPPVVCVCVRIDADVDVDDGAAAAAAAARRIGPAADDLGVRVRERRGHDGASITVNYDDSGGGRVGRSGGGGR